MGGLHTGVEGPRLKEAPVVRLGNDIHEIGGGEGRRNMEGNAGYFRSQDWRTLPPTSHCQNSITGPHLTAGDAVKCNLVVFPGREQNEFGEQTLHPI